MHQTLAPPDSSPQVSCPTLDLSLKPELFFSLKVWWGEGGLGIVCFRDLPQGVVGVKGGWA